MIGPGNFLAVTPSLWWPLLFLALVVALLMIAADPPDSTL